MPGYIRGSAKQRGRAALTAPPLFGAESAVSVDLDPDGQKERMDQKFGAPMVVTEEAFGDSKFACEQRVR